MNFFPFFLCEITKVFFWMRCKRPHLPCGWLVLAAPSLDRARRWRPVSPLVAVCCPASHLGPLAATWAQWRLCIENPKFTGMYGSAGE
jgi:hypothetical protein